MEAVQRTQRSGGHLLIEAGTGTGKTVAMLAAALETQRKDGRTIVWATRTNSQQTQVVREHHAILAGDDGGLLVPFMGRRHYCPQLREDERFRDGTPEELGRLCRDAKRKAIQSRDTGRPVKGACPYYARLLEDGPGPVEALLRTGAESAESLASLVERAGSCPYEALKQLMPNASVIVVPYIFVLDDRLRSTLLQWIGVGSDECHLVVDEAHNIPAATRDLHTPKLSQVAIARAIKEAIDWKDPPLAGVTVATSVLAALERVIGRIAAEYVHNGEDGLVPPGIVQEELMMELHVPSPTIRAIAVDLETWGEAIREERRAKGRLPRSYLGGIGAFLHAWTADLAGDRVSIVTGGDNPALERFLLDPAAVLGWMHEWWSTSHMSGTLAPLQEHLAVLGLPPHETDVLDLGDPYGPEQLQIAAVAGLHRRYEDVQRDPELTHRQQAWARAMLDGLPGRCALWFPSHRMLQAYLEEGFLHGCERPLHVEQEGMAHSALRALVNKFCKDPRPGALLLGVLGGRLTEGIDYPGDALEAVLIFGVPYPKPTARSQALIHHYDRVTGNGWSVAVQTPVGRVLRQAVGRIVRGPEDRGIAVILDERAMRFHAHLRNIRTVERPAEVLAGSPYDGYETAASRLRGPKVSSPVEDETK